MRGWAEQGIHEGSWLRAGCQSAGRGRMGRAWESPLGNLYASTWIGLRADDPPAHLLALVVANAVHAAVAPLCNGRTVIKWPNDLLIDGAKVAGILLERVGDAVIIGIGANVAAFPAHLERPVTSLADKGATVDAATLLEGIAANLNQWISVWRGQGLAPVRAYWIANAHPAGSPMRVAQPDGTLVDGRFETLDDHGMLILRLDNDTTRAIHAGDVILI